MKRLEISRDSLAEPMNAATARSAQGGGTGGWHEYRRPTSFDDTFTIVIIDPRQLIRECLTWALRELSPSSTVRPFSTVSEWQAVDNRPATKTIVLFCLGNRSRSRPEIERELALLSESDAHVVLLSEDEDAGQILEALDSGAKGYIPTSVPLEVAFEAIRLVKAGGVYVPASSLVASRRSIEEASSPRLRSNGMFTERQAAVVEALRQGKANKIIAYELNMRESTVKVHIRNIMKKLKARNRTEVAYLTHALFADQGEAWSSGGPGK